MIHEGGSGGGDLLSPGFVGPKSRRPQRQTTLAQIVAMIEFMEVPQNFMVIEGLVEAPHLSASFKISGYKDMALYVNRRGRVREGSSAAWDKRMAKNRYITYRKKYMNAAEELEQAVKAAAEKYPLMEYVSSSSSRSHRRRRRRKDKADEGFSGGDDNEHEEEEDDQGDDGVMEYGDDDGNDVGMQHDCDGDALMHSKDYDAVTELAEELEEERINSINHEMFARRNQEIQEVVEKIRSEVPHFDRMHNLYLSHANDMHLARKRKRKDENSSESVKPKPQTANESHVQPPNPSGGASGPVENPLNLEDDINQSGREAEGEGDDGNDGDGDGGPVDVGEYVASTYNAITHLASVLAAGTGHADASGSTSVDEMHDDHSLADDPMVDSPRLLFSTAAANQKSRLSLSPNPAAARATIGGGPNATGTGGTDISGAIMPSPPSTSTLSYRSMMARSNQAQLQMRTNGSSRASSTCSSSAGKEKGNAGSSKLVPSMVAALPSTRHAPQAVSLNGGVSSSSTHTPGQMFDNGIGPLSQEMRIEWDIRKRKLESEERIQLKRLMLEEKKLADEKEARDRELRRQMITDLIAKGKTVEEIKEIMDALFLK